MNVTRSYNSPARQARRQHTMQAIAKAFITQLGESGRATLSPAAATRAAGGQSGLCTTTSTTPTPSSPQSRTRSRPGYIRTRPRSPVSQPNFRSSSGRSTSLPKTSCPCSAPWFAAASDQKSGPAAGPYGWTRSGTCWRAPAPARPKAGTPSPWSWASADAGIVVADQYDGLILEEAGRACAQATRAIVGSLTPQGVAPRTPSGK